MNAGPIAAERRQQQVSEAVLVAAGGFLLLRVVAEGHRRQSHSDCLQSSPRQASFKAGGRFLAQAVYAVFPRWPAESVMLLCAWPSTGLFGENNRTWSISPGIAVVTFYIT
jgi:hypothetical protein